MHHLFLKDFNGDVRGLNAVLHVDGASNDTVGVGEHDGAVGLARHVVSNQHFLACQGLVISYPEACFHGHVDDGSPRLGGVALGYD